MYLPGAKLPYIRSDFSASGVHGQQVGPVQDVDVIYEYGDPPAQPKPVTVTPAPATLQASGQTEIKIGLVPLLALGLVGYLLLKG